MATRSEHGASTLSQAAAGERLPTLPVTLAYVQACDGDRAEWEQRWRQAAEDAAAVPRPAEGGEPPYRGLARYEPGDADLFFGRDQVTHRLTDLTRQRRLSAVFGPSGSGKSSLLRAGLIPRLQHTTDPALRPAALRVFTPGPHPLRIHGDRLSAQETGEGDTWLIVDQFEELYTLCTDPAERSAFLERLLEATDPASRLRVVLAIRADFLGRCAEHAGLTAALQESTVLVGPMGPAELREAITKPAQATGLLVERSLTARLIEEVEDAPGALPLMSHALLETWRRRQSRALTEVAYTAAGGLNGAIARTAEDLYTGLTPAQAGLARRLLLRLVTPGDDAPDTRRPTPRSELAALEAGGEVGTVLDRLIRARLLTADEGTVDLAHEALLTAWPRLHTWVEEDRERLRAHRQLTEAATTWDELGRDPGTLYRGTRLAGAAELWPPSRYSELTDGERAFLTAGLAAERRARLRRRLTAGLAACVALLLVVAGTVAYIERDRSRQRADELASKQIAAQADALREEDPVTCAARKVVAARHAAYRYSLMRPRRMRVRSSR
ncbi:hypothetical protein [Streptomyces rapamycinicus]|nr:hypothetical protein [Streptomyces rapamycinicus]MBB4786995.1 hypothetical protein [Streptomyces rapamycinicus]